MTPGRHWRAALLALCLAVAGGARADAPPASVPAASGAATPHGAIPFKQDKQGGGSLAYQSVAGLVLAGLAAYGIVLGLKRYGGSAVGGPLRRQRRLQMVESLRLSRKSVLHVVDYQGEQLLLAESEHGLQLVSTRAGVADV
jgi:hypothetical protein